MLIYSSWFCRFQFQKLNVIFLFKLDRCHLRRIFLILNLFHDNIVWNWIFNFMVSRFKKDNCTQRVDLTFLWVIINFLYSFFLQMTLRNCHRLLRTLRTFTKYRQITLWQIYRHHRPSWIHLPRRWAVPCLLHHHRLRHKMVNTRWKKKVCVIFCF